MEQSEPADLSSFTGCFSKYEACKEVNSHLELQREFCFTSLHPDGKINTPLQSRFILVLGELKETLCSWSIIAKHLLLAMRR